MEVILKKYKITKTIIQQSTRPTEKEIKDLDVLGWCLYKTTVYKTYRKGN